MIPQEKQTFLGTGWNFPVTFNFQQSTTQLVSNADCIRQNIWMLLSTRQGERPMYPDYGHQLYLMSFQMMSETLIYRIQEHLHYIFMIHEPRVTLEEIDIQLDEEHDHIVHLHLDYLIRETNTRTNMVFPYYLIEN